MPSAAVAVDRWSVGSVPHGILPPSGPAPHLPSAALSCAGRSYTYRSVKWVAKLPVCLDISVGAVCVLVSFFFIYIFFIVVWLCRSQIEDRMITSSGRTEQVRNLIIIACQTAQDHLRKTHHR